MDLKDILSQKDFSEPTEITKVKEYILRKFHEKVAVRGSNDSLTIIATSAAMASAIRGNLPELKSYAGSSKKIIIRIGSS
jgi:hypothetical protein